MLPQKAGARPQMDHEQLEPGELPTFLLGLFPPAMRVSVLENKEFRDRLGLSVDANIGFDQIGITFRRSVLFTNVRNLLSSKVIEAYIEDTEKVAWSMSIDTERTRIKIATENRIFFIPDFSCLHPDSAERLKWFDQEVGKFGVNDARMQQWREVLEERSAEDEEVDELLKEFRLGHRGCRNEKPSTWRRGSRAHAGGETEAGHWDHSGKCDAYQYDCRGSPRGSGGVVQICWRVHYRILI